MARVPQGKFPSLSCPECSFQWSGPLHLTRRRCRECQVEYLHFPPALLSCPSPQHTTYPLVLKANPWESVVLSGHSFSGFEFTPPPTPPPQLYLQWILLFPLPSPVLKAAIPLFFPRKDLSLSLISAHLAFFASLTLWWVKNKWWFCGLSCLFSLLKPCNILYPNWQQKSLPTFSFNACTLNSHGALTSCRCSCRWFSKFYWTSRYSFCPGWSRRFLSNKLNLALLLMGMWD